MLRLALLLRNDTRYTAKPCSFSAYETDVPKGYLHPLPEVRGSKPDLPKIQLQEASMHLTSASRLGLRLSFGRKLMIKGLFEEFAGWCFQVFSGFNVGIAIYLRGLGLEFRAVGPTNKANTPRPVAPKQILTPQCVRSSFHSIEDIFVHDNVEG